MNDPVIFPCREEIKPETEISPEGQTALALAHQEQDARDGLRDYPAPEDGDDDPDPPAACPGCTDADCDCEGVSECERCGAIPATAHGTTGADEVVYLCRPCWQADRPDCGGPDYPAASPDCGDDRPSRIVVHVGPVRVETIHGVPPGSPRRKRPVTYLHPDHGWYAQYAGAQAGYYPGARRSARREAEISAHRAGVRQIGRYELLQAERRGLRDVLLCEAVGLSLPDWSSWPDPDTTEETLPQDLPGWEPWPERDPQVCDPVVAYPVGDYQIGDAEDLLGGASALRALTGYPSEISEGGTEVLPAPPRPWWWTALCVLREQGDIPQQIAYLESVIRTEARRLVPTAPPDDPDPHPALRPLTGQESVELYRAAVHVGRLEEVFAAADRPTRLRELYSVLCGGAL